MATWKKVIVSGSSAALSTLTLDTDLAIAQGGTGASTVTAARTALGVDAAGTDNSTATTIVSGVSTPNYITISGQAITPGLIDLASDITGVLPSANLDADTAHLTTDQTFTGNKTFSAPITGSHYSGSAISTGSFSKIAGTLTTAAQSNVTSLGTLSALAVTMGSSNYFTLGVDEMDNTVAKINNMTIGATTAASGKFTTLEASGNISGSSASTGSFGHILKGGINWDTAVSASAATAGFGTGGGGGGEANESSFKTISISTNMSAAAVVADQDDDTLSIAEGAGLAISTTAASDTITFAVDGALEDLDTLGAAGSDGQFIVATGAGAFAYESGTTVRTSLGLGTGDNVTHNNVTVDGDLIVNGSRTVLNTTNLTVEDKFVFIATGSAASNTDGGILVQSGSADQTGSALYHDTNSQRWAVQKTVASNATAVTPLHHVVTAKIEFQGPSASDGDYGAGEMWIDAEEEDIYIRTS